MTTSPTVSVIIPCYNRHDLLGRAIDSVLTQTWSDFELIVVDDGSTDGSAAFVQEIQDPRVRCIVHPVNRGLAAAWNTGVRAARGEWVAFLDSDDSWHPEKLRRQVSFHQEHPDCFVSTTGYRRLGTYPHARVIPSEKQARYRQILFHNTLALGSTIMAKPAIFEQIGGFDENLRRGQDTDWLLRFSREFNVRVVPEILATIYKHTDRSAAILEEARVNMLEKHREDYRHFGTVFLRRKTARLWSDVAYQYERENNRAKMRQYAAQSIAAFPFQSPGIYLILADALTGFQVKKKATEMKQAFFIRTRRKSQS